MNYQVTLLNALGVYTEHTVRLKTTKDLKWDEFLATPEIQRLLADNVNTRVVDITPEDFDFVDNDVLEDFE